MILRSLDIINFKSIATASCSFSPKLNCFIGLNGMGKTNLLDALHYLSFTKSHLSITDGLAVRRGEEAAILEGHYQSSHQDERHLLLQIRPRYRKILKRNKKEYERITQHIGQFPLVIVSPQDSHLIQGGSEERRRFLDQQLSQQDPAYLSALSQYNKTLQQRNSLLKTESLSLDLLDVLDLQLDRLAQLIWRRRQEFVRDFVPYFQSYYTAISAGGEQVSLTYQSRLTDTEGRLYELLRETRERDKILGYTSRGVHKDDLEMLLDGELIRRIGSEGQNKTFLISLKFAQYALQLSKNSEVPILLLDDIFDKLDSDRVERIIRLVGSSDFGQIFITDTNRKSLDTIVKDWGLDYKLFAVSQGNVEEVTQQPQR